MSKIAVGKIPFVDLKAQYSSIRDEIHEAINGVLEDTNFILGKHVRKFEEDFARFCGVKFAVGVGNGTEAITLALKALGICPEDEVITVPNTAAPTAEAITSAGARVVFVDIDPDTYNIDASKIAEKITKKTKAIVPVHLYGQPCNLGEVMRVAKTFNLKVIEDAAQAHGAMYEGKRVGSIGEAGCFSFYPSKNLGCYGDGGAVVTNDKDIALKVSMLRDHGRKEKYLHAFEGHNSRLDAIQAAVLQVKLKYIDEWNERRRKNAQFYTELLSDVKGVTVPKILMGAVPVFHLYVIKVKDRDSLVARLKEEGIETGIHYPLPLHLQPAYAYLGMEKGSYPAAEFATEHIISLPMFPELNREQIEMVVDAIREYLSLT